MKRFGLTLVELLIVIGIIAVLAGIIWAVFAPSREKSRFTHCVSNFRQLYLALESYRQDWDGVDVETAQNFDDLAFPLTPYIVTGQWPFQKVVWIWGTQELWLCPSRVPNSRMKLYGGVFLDYNYRVWPRYGLYFPPDVPESDRKYVRRTVAQLEQEFRRRRGEFVLLVDEAHGEPPKWVGPGNWLCDALILRINGQIQFKRQVNLFKPEEW